MRTQIYYMVPCPTNGISIGFLSVQPFLQGSPARHTHKPRYVTSLQQKPAFPDMLAKQVNKNGQTTLLLLSATV